MTLRQLRYICEVARHELNISAAAAALYTSQSGISKQIQLLEEELGIQIFGRSGRQLTHITRAGANILKLAEDMVQQAGNLQQVALEARDEKRGSLSIATTHTQARHVLPPVVMAFRQHYPEVNLQMHQAAPAQVAELAARGSVDFVIATEAIEHVADLVLMPSYRWNHVVVVPPGHALDNGAALTLERLAGFPLITYVPGVTGRARIDEAFAARELDPRVVLASVDADVIKTYVRLGLGAGIIARMAGEQDGDTELRVLAADHLFTPSTTSIGFRRGLALRGYMYEFIRLFAPHLTHERVECIAGARSTAERQRLIAELDPLVPVR
jgi:LysR family transcriptional regulator, cys regulon transcriptional activator